MHAEINALSARCGELSADCTRFNVNGQLGLAAKAGRELAEVSEELARKRGQVAAIEAAKPRTFSPAEKARAEAEIDAATAEAAIPFSKAITRRAIGIADEVARLVLDALAEHDAKRARFNAATVLAQEFALPQPKEPATLGRSRTAIARALVAVSGAAMIFRNMKHAAIVTAPGGASFVVLDGDHTEVTQSDITLAANALAGTSAP